MSLEKILSKKEAVKEYFRGCVDSENARLYGTLQERLALNITQFHLIQGSMFWRMGLVYPQISQLTYPIVASVLVSGGMPEDGVFSIFGMELNAQIWAASYAAYGVEVIGGMSKYSFDLIGKITEKYRGRGEPEQLRLWD